MLVLSRKPGESIVIDDDIVVTVVDVRGGQVRIGIQAPHHVAVHREEVFDQARRGGVPTVEGTDEAGPRMAGGTSRDIQPEGEQSGVGEAESS